MRRIAIFSIVFSLALAVAAGYIVSTSAGYDTLSQEMRVRQLFVKQAFNTTSVNSALSEAGISMKITGELDAINNPKDDYIGFASQYLRVGQDSRTIIISVVSFLILLCVNISTAICLFIRSRPQRL